MRPDIDMLLQVTYPLWFAKHLHRVPLIIALALPLFNQSGQKQRQSIGSSYLDLLRCAFIALLSSICALIIPAAFSFLFVRLTGKLFMSHSHNFLSPKGFLKYATLV